jgi:WD40 repeat protein
MRVWLAFAACASILSGCGPNTTAPPAPVGNDRKPLFLSDLPARPQLMFVSVSSDDSHQHLSVASLAAVDRGRYVTPLACNRIYFAGTRGICLASEAQGNSAVHFARLFDEQFQPTHRVALTGPPSRVRISPDGRRAAATVFESGHSYAQEGFSTRTTVIDLAEGRVICDLEEFAVWKDGQRIHEKDFNFWGLTFARDGNEFYATLETGGVSYLVRGDIDRREIRVVRAGVECPSLSPDGTKLVFKKRLGSRSRGWWQLARFDVATNEETVLDKESRSVDDQVEWIDSQTVMYHLTGTGSAADLWTLAVDGSSGPKLLLREAYSPAVVR